MSTSQEYQLPPNDNSMPGKEDKKSEAMSEISDVKTVFISFVENGTFHCTVLRSLLYGLGCPKVCIVKTLSHFGSFGRGSKLGYNHSMVSGLP